MRQNFFRQRAIGFNARLPAWAKFTAKFTAVVVVPTAPIAALIAIILPIALTPFVFFSKIAPKLAKNTIYSIFKLFTPLYLVVFQIIDDSFEFFRRIIANHDLAVVQSAVDFDFGADSAG